MPLTDWRASTESDGDDSFLDNVRGLIAAGYAARAIAVLHSRACRLGYRDLASTIDPRMIVPVLENWKTIRTHCAVVAANPGERSVLTLSLVCRSDKSNSGEVRFDVRGAEDEMLRVSGPSGGEAAPRLGGVDSLLSAIHKPPPGSTAERRDLAHWALTACFARAVLEARTAEPLPGETSLALKPDYTPRSMECGFVDLLPSFRFSFEPKGECLPDAAAQLRAERAEKNRANFQQTWVEFVAETREIHRMLRYFPFYRFRGRNELAKLWESQLAMACRATGIEPMPRISWRMNGRRLQSLLRRIVEVKSVPDADDALDPRHTDRLHESWLATARAAGFRLGAGFSMFELQLASALHKGGPWVADRWERAKPYAQEHRLA